MRQVDGDACACVLACCDSRVVLPTGWMMASTRLDKEMLCAMTEENGSGNDEETGSLEQHKYT